jgi:AcrR family transcriptional regulator
MLPAPTMSGNVLPIMSTGHDQLPVARPGLMRTARGERAEQALAKAVLDLLDEEGFSRITVDKIAARAKVGKPTIYRRWDNKEQLISHVLGQIVPPDLTQPDAELRPALVAILTNLERRFTDTRFGRIYRRLVGEADNYPEVTALYHEQFVRPRRRAVAELLRHHVRTGELRADLDCDTAADILFGGMLGALLLPGGSVGVPNPEAVVDLMIDGMRA